MKGSMRGPSDDTVLYLGSGSSHTNLHMWKKSYRIKCAHTHTHARTQMSRVQLGNLNTGFCTNIRQNFLGWDIKLSYAGLPLESLSGGCMRSLCMISSNCMQIYNYFKIESKKKKKERQILGLEVVINVLFWPVSEHFGQNPNWHKWSKEDP